MLYDQVTDLAPDLRAAWFNKAILYEHQLREPFEAIRCYLRAVDIEPTDIASTRSIGVLYYRNGHFKKARYWLEKLINWGERHHELTWMYERSKEEGQGRALAFISYSWCDKDAADRLRRALDAASIEYFIDQSRIPQVESFPEPRWQIEQGLAQSDTAIVLWSRHATRSRWVCLELCSTTAMLKKIVIHRLDDTALSLTKWTVTPRSSTAP